MEEPTSVLPIAGAVDDSDSAMDVVDLLALAAFTNGQQPYAKTVHLDNVRVDATLLPESAVLFREAVGGEDFNRLATGSGWTLHAVRWKHSRRATVTVTATSAELAEHIAKAATDGAVKEKPRSDSTVPLGFWHMSQRGPRRNSRAINAEPWSKIRGNYASRTAGAFDKLMALGPDGIDGRLLLLHGPPGTGKTTALRALARQWRKWCQVDCVLDPERLFSEPAYLMDVAMGEDGGDGRRRWRLLILEDCDELIRGEAKQAAGQALARLLNLTDGLLGQGRDVLVAITTNEDLARLHPAVVRPGRCLARIEAGPLPYEEAAAWLGRPDGLRASGATLAELYALRSGTRPDTLDPDPPIGQYL